MPPPRKTTKRARRLRRALACAAAISGVLLTTAGTGHADPYAAPVPLPALAPSMLAARYAAERASIEEARRTARDVGDRDRARALGRFLEPDRTFLFFDPRRTGRAIEVIGDLATARRVVMLVPGADTSLSTFDDRSDKPWSTPGGGARAVYDQARRTDPRAAAGLAVIAWLGYAAPRTLSSEVLSDDRARQGGAALRRFLGKVQRVAPSARFGLLCHSYGSAVCGQAALDQDGPDAAPWRKVSDIALYGSPGTAAWRASRIGGRARVWAGRGSGDWMGDIPHLRFLGFGLGPDPVSPEFGARVFNAGRAGHSDYLRPGSGSLRNLSNIALGEASHVTRTSHR